MRHKGSFTSDALRCQADKKSLGTKKVMKIERGSRLEGKNRGDRSKVGKEDREAKSERREDGRKEEEAK